MIAAIFAAGLLLSLVAGAILWRSNRTLRRQLAVEKSIVADLCDFTGIRVVRGSANVDAMAKAIGCTCGACKSKERVAN